MRPRKDHQAFIKQQPAPKPNVTKASDIFQLLGMMLWINMLAPSTNQDRKRFWIFG